MPSTDDSPRRDSGFLVTGTGSRRGSDRTKKGRYRDKGGKTAYLYCITDGEHYKIGWAVNPARRLKELQIGNPRELSIHSQLRCSCTAQAIMRERNLHKQYRQHRVRGEWFTEVVATRPFGKYKEKTP